MALHSNDILYFVILDRFYGAKNNIKEGIDKKNPFSFHGGNLDGIVEKIPYLKKLGVTVVWITPVYLQIPLVDHANNKTYEGYHGYWALDFNAIDPHFYVDNGKYEKGSKKYLKDFVNKMHQNGIKVVLDMVVNHTGYNHPAITASADNPTPIQPDWFNSFGLCCSQDVIKGSLSGLPDMDLDKIDVINYHIDTILSWIAETGIDAIRMDTVRHVEKRFWYVYKTQIKGKFPDIDLLGEVLEFDANAIANYQKLFDFDSLFDFPLQQTIKDTIIFGAPLTNLVSPFDQGNGILEKDHLYTNPSMLVTLLDNHDLSARFMTWAITFAGGADKKQFAMWLQKLALTFLFTIRGIPQIYYGTEYGMEGSYDPDNRRDFEWEKFDKNYNVKNEFPIEKEIFEHTCKLIQLRKQNEALSIGNFITLYTDYFILAYLRYFKDNLAIIILHNGWLPMNEPLKISIANENNIPSKLRKKLMNSNLQCSLTKEKISIKNGEFYIQMQPKSAYLCIL